MFDKEESFVGVETGRKLADETKAVDVRMKALERIGETKNASLVMGTWKANRKKRDGEVVNLLSVWSKNVVSILNIVETNWS